ncbi:MAG TPA: response regulator transcription factor [Acidimicrobiales bacterium]|nr:response regulator transcription factor [Acidimicrobiales bacterium]
MTEPAEDTTRVVVASDFFLTREGLACLLAGVPGIEVIGRVDSHAAALEAAGRDQPDVVVVGIRAGRAATDDTLNAAQLLRAEHPGVGIVVVALEGDHFALELLRQGAGGMAFLLDDRISDLDVLVRAIAQARGGQVTLDSSVVDALIGRRGGSRLDELTLRELDVLAEMAKGYRNRVIAEKLSVSVKAVESHATSIFRKLGVTDQQRFDRRVAAVIAYLETFGS